MHEEIQASLESARMVESCRRSMAKTVERPKSMEIATKGWKGRAMAER